MKNSKMQIAGGAALCVTAAAIAIWADVFSLPWDFIFVSAGVLVGALAGFLAAAGARSLTWALSKADAQFLSALGAVGGSALLILAAIVVSLVAMSFCMAMALGATAVLAFVMALAALGGILLGDALCNRFKPRDQSAET